MKAVVLEVKDGYAALLQDDGIVVRIKNNKFTTGDVVQMKEKPMRRKVGLRAIAAAAAIFFMLTGAGALIYDTPAYYVSLDVNPSVMMEVNLFERVIGMEALNADAEEILSGLALRNKNIEEAISRVIARIEEKGYLDEDGANILIASIAKNDEKAERLAGKLREAVEEEIDDNGVKAEISSGAIGYDMVQAAKALDITPGKLNIITNLLGEEVNDENINESVRDLMARFTAEKGAEGKARAQEASGRSKDSDDNGEPTEDENGEPSENADLKEQNAARKAEEAVKQEKNAPVDTPATTKKSEKATKMQDNASDQKTEGAGKPDGIGKPDGVGNPEGIGKPDGVGKPEGVGRP